MKISEILVKAAEQMESGQSSRFSCNAISNLGKDDGAAEVFYKALYRPDSPSPENGLAWADHNPYTASNGWDIDDRDVRVVALCFAAAVAESESK